jgi:hypothetical protein
LQGLLSGAARIKTAVGPDSQRRFFFLTDSVGFSVHRPVALHDGERFSSARSNTGIGNGTQLEYRFGITASRQLSVTESVVLPPLGTTIMKISEKYRRKALACEKLAREVPNYDFKCAWTEIAIGWHELAGRRAQEVSQDRELNNKPR